MWCSVIAALFSISFRLSLAQDLSEENSDLFSESMFTDAPLPDLILFTPEEPSSEEPLDILSQGIVADSNIPASDTLESSCGIELDTVGKLRLRDGKICTDHSVPFKPPPLAGWDLLGNLLNSEPPPEVKKGAAADPSRMRIGAPYGEEKCRWPFYYNLCCDEEPTQMFGSYFGPGIVWSNVYDCYLSKCNVF